MRARLVDDYTAQAPGYERTYLDLLFDRATLETVPAFFNNIWIPTRAYDPNTQKLSENYTYYNVGITSADMSDLYWTEYSGNYLIGRKDDIAVDFTYLLTRVKSIFKKNLGKYKRLVELEGLIWNPLWNVDGTEIHQLLEKHASENNLFSESGASATGKNLETTHNVSAYNSTTKTEYTDEQKGKGSSSGPSATVTYGQDTLTSTGGAVADVDTSSSEARASRSHKTHDSFSYAVKVEDTAFGVAINDGGDVLHTEKTVRQGNIGVTKTTELIEDARRTVAYSIIQEFFDDINEVILVGLYNVVDPIPWWASGQGSGGQSTPEHPDTGRISSVYNSGYDMIQSVELDQYGHVIGLTTGDGVTKVFTPMTEEQYQNTDPKDQTLYHIYD